jgi:hypothetical protein
MRGFEFFEELRSRPHFVFLHVFEALTDALPHVCSRGDIQQALLDNGRSLAFHGRHYGTLALLQLFEELARAAAKYDERLNIFSDIEDRHRSILEHLLRCSAAARHRCYQARPDPAGRVRQVCAWIGTVRW